MMRKRIKNIVPNASMRKKNSSRKNIMLYFLLLILFTIILLAIYVFAYSNFDVATIMIILISLVSIGILAITISSIKSALDSTHTVINVAMIGFKASGKTVYWTVLLNNMMGGTRIVEDYNEISIIPRGNETIKKITTNYNLLEKGEPFPSTPEGEPSHYFAGLTMNSNESLLSIVDYDGESYANEEKNSSIFFFRTSYFKEVSKSHILFFAVDLRKVYGEEQDDNYVADFRSSIKHHILSIMEEKKFGLNKKINFPVALVFLKNDLFANELNSECVSDMVRAKTNNTNLTDEECDAIVENEATLKFADIISFFTKHCEPMYFKYYFISSLGREYLRCEKGEPKPTDDIAKPLIWAIKQHVTK